MQTIEVTCRTACNRIKRMPYSYDLNIYRGCQHGCKYCYAPYSHDYIAGMKPGSFFKSIVVKTNICEQLEKQFSSSSWKGEAVNIGSVCDSYQPLEENYKLMPEILKIFIKYKNPCIISTKSDLILRDFNLIDELSHLTYVNIACTITTCDESVRRKLEPGGSPSSHRYNVIKEFSKTKVSRGVHIMPIVPFITDSYDNLSALYRNAFDADASYVLTSFLNLKGPTRGAFFEFINKEYSDHFDAIVNLYQGENSKKNRKEYKKQIYGMINQLQKKYSLYSNYIDFMGTGKKEDIVRQMTVF